MKRLVLTLFLLSALQGGFAQRSDDYSSLVEGVMPSIVLINTYDERGTRLKRGTGFCIAPNLFMTNFHVIENARRITIRTSDDRVLSVTLDSVNAKADLAILKAAQDISVKPLRFAPSLPKIGERIVVVGNPLGLTGTVSDGIVSAIRNAEEEYIQITAPISPGSSGSPVLNLKGQVVGVATLNLEGGQSLNFALSSHYVQNLWPTKVSVSRGSTTRTNKPKALSSRWRFLNNEETTYDKQTLSKIGDIVSVWLNYAEKDGNYEKVLYEINCSTRSIRQVQETSYDVDGKVTRSSSSPAAWASVIPDSNGESYFSVFCKGSSDLQAEMELDEQYESGKSFEESNDYASAIDAYWQALRLSYELKGPVTLSGALWRALAEWALEQIYRKQNDVEGFAKLYNFGISKGSHYKYRNLAELYKKHGMSLKFQSAVRSGLKVFEPKILSANATSSDYTVLADLYVLQNLNQKAMAVLLRGKTRFPNDEFIALNLARLYSKNKKFSDCIETLKKAVVNAKYFRKEMLTLMRDSYRAMGLEAEASKIEIELRSLT